MSRSTRQCCVSANKNDGFLRVAAASPQIRVADVEGNAEVALAAVRAAVERGVRALVLPELNLCGYTAADLFHNRTLLHACEAALVHILDETRELPIVFTIGLPVAVAENIYNCAAVCCAGELLGLTAKKYLPNYGEFYERRWFAPAPADPVWVEFAGQGPVPLGSELVYRCCDEGAEDMVLGVEVCEDLWVPNPPSTALAQMGAHIIVNLSASDEIIGKAGYRRDLVRQQSGRLLCAYLYADAGFGESTQDLVFAGHDLIAENGALLAESKMFSQGIIYADIDLQRLAHERQRMNTFASIEGGVFSFSLEPVENDLADRTFPRTPFVPANKALRDERCEEILTLQATGLATRLRHTHAKTAVVGLSGGLDSTLALIVLVHAFDMLELDRKGILAVTMPCFGTTARTKGNAEKLAEAYGVTLKTVDIKAAVDQHFMDIGQSKDDLSVTFENGQARMRTLVLMNLANKNGGMVVGTGDLSELALGWATYNGDHMSMYGVNGSIPKTLVRYLVAYEADRTLGELSDVLQDVLDTPVSPELLPPKDGEISQKTEDLVGPYELHDFFLYYMLRFGYPPRKIFRAAHKTFAGVYDDATIKKWLTTFMRRFFTQQFKRSCLPDGPKVGTVTLSPRGDWRMPSDAVSALWLKEAESL